MSSATLILSNQIFENNPNFKKNQPIFIVELDYFFNRYNFHKKKLVFHRATAKFYENYLADLNYKVFYVEYTEKIFSILVRKKIKEIEVLDPLEKNVLQYLKHQAKAHNIVLKVTPNLHFLSNEEFLKDNLIGKNKFLFNNFYKNQRKELKILIDSKNKPIGGKWSYDYANRKKMPHNINLPKIWTPKANNFIKEACDYVLRNFKNNIGTTENFIYPTNFDDSRLWFDNFLEFRMANFGIYEDAIDKNNPFLFHSIISPLLNIGLLTPNYVIKRTLEFAKHNKVDLNSLEGFIRQIIGWREYVWGVYKFHSEYQINSNFFNHNNSLPKSFWNAQTGIEPVDNTISSLIDTAYAHHILRLMVMGNFMLLCQIHPDDVYKWFMEFFIDSYDWVMVPNVYGMSQFSDGGLIVTKPYISSSNYILKMSNYKRDGWADIWDALFWRFVHINSKKLSEINRTRLMVSNWHRKNKADQKNLIRTAENFLKDF